MKTESNENFINRELSWLEFNQRVLEEAQKTTTPLFERLKFLSIVSSNLDEFFMVRVGSLFDQIKANFNKKDPSGLTPEQQINAISKRVHKLVYDQYNTFTRSLKVNLKKENLNFVKPSDLTSLQFDFINKFYEKNIYPVLTPMVVDQSRPFPLIQNRSLNIGLILEDNNSCDIFGTIQVPSVLNRILELPTDTGKAFILLEDIIKLHLSSLFNGHVVKDYSCYRVTRNADLSIDEEGAEDLLVTISESLQMRKWGCAVRLEVEHNISSKLIKTLQHELEIIDRSTYEISGPLDLRFLNIITSYKDYSHLEYAKFNSNKVLELCDEKIFDIISSQDVLLHHPFESFDPIINLVEQASIDPDVLAIKQTLYRVSGNSPIIAALINAANLGKQVTVLVELKARFDENNNIKWAKQLEEAGCHVIYGLVGLKTHCKVLLVVRRESNGIKRYVHLGTGNYNDITAKFYTDLGLFSCNPQLGSDVSSLFNMLSGHSKPTSLNKLCIAPIFLRDRFINLIKNEIKHALDGKEAKIIAKMNSLVDTEIIECLYEASKAGVKIDLVVRGICCLKPSVEGLSENITVRSIVGRLLEHSRIYYFYNGGDELIYLSSADLMTRNLDRRVETLFPIDDLASRNKIKKLLHISLNDTTNARILHSDGSYTNVDKRGKEILSSQEVFYDIASKCDDTFLYVAADKSNWNEKGFKPMLKITD